MVKEGFVASDGWDIKGDTAWFTGIEYNAIFKTNLQTLECEIVCQLPVDDLWAARVNPICIKLEDYIVCLPSLNSSIYLYNIKDNSFQELHIDMPEKVSPDILHYWYDIKLECVFAFSRGLQRVLTIDIKNQKVLLSDRINEHINARYAIRVEQYLWLPNSLDNRIFSYNLYTGEINEYLLSNVKGRLYAICYDGAYFWITGNRREIYRWKKGDDLVSIINDFPDEFYEYTIYEENMGFMKETFNEVPFVYCVYCSNSIWCIPYQTNMILGIDKDTHAICGIDGGETAGDILNRVYNHKYLLEYIREDRYIGLFSLCENCIFELDTQKYKMEKRDYYLVKEKIEDNNFPVFYESGINKFFYQTFLERKESNTNKEMLRTGRKLYNKIVKQHK